MSTKKERMYRAIEKHGNNLKALFGVEGDAVALCKQLRRLEVKAHRLATDYCNGENGVDSENWDSKCEPILKAVDKLLNYTAKGYPVYVNGDARGYALKIDSECMKDEGIELYQDWGGYGILAPDFSQE